MGGYSTSSGHVGRCTFGCHTHKGPLRSSVFHPLFFSLTLLCCSLKKGVIQGFPLGDALERTMVPGLPIEESDLLNLRSPVRLREIGCNV
jgi:hypothetical protein